MGPAEARAHCKLEPPAQSLLKAAMAQLHRSTRACQRVLKLARTIADLAGLEQIGPAELAEALQYRQRGQT